MYGMLHYYLETPVQSSRDVVLKRIFNIFNKTVQSQEEMGGNVVCKFQQLWFGHMNI